MKLREAGFRPRLLVLKEGECLAIPCGVPHIFRKMCLLNNLKKDDCFYYIRKNHIQEHGEPSRECMSIACDNCWSSDKSIFMHVHVIP